jgi:hypothetical protein
MEPHQTGIGQTGLDRAAFGLMNYGMIHAVISSARIPLFQLDTAAMTESADHTAGHMLNFVICRQN